MESFTSTWVCITTRRWRPQKSRVSSTCVWCNGTYDFLAQIRVLLTKPRMMRSAYDRPVKQSEALCRMHCVYWPLEIIVDEEWEVTTECPLFSSSLRCFAVIPQWCWKMKYVAAPHFLIVVFSRVGWTKPAEFVEKHFQHMYHTNKIVSSVYGSVVKISCASLNVHHSN